MTDKPARARAITINGCMPNVGILVQLEHSLGAQLPDGEYWYDYLCGACGVMGGPTLGFLRPGLALAGPLPADASGASGTGCFVNGRELHAQDITGLNQLLMRVGGQCLPGRWSLDATGNLGPEDGVALVNLTELVRLSDSGSIIPPGGLSDGGTDSSWSTRFASGNSTGSSGFIHMPGGGFASYGMG